MFFLQKKSFTLIELLVVISIIATLAGMLLPALNRMRDSGRMTKCISNLKQIGLAYISYMNDSGYTVKIWNSSSSRWMDTLEPWIGKNIYTCPADLRNERDQSVSYGISYVLSADPDSQTNTDKLWYNVKENRIVRPSEFITISDISSSYYFGNGTVKKAEVGELNKEIAVTDGFCKFISFRHGNSVFRFPAALADGHVEQFSFYQMSDRFWDLKNKGGYGGEN